MGVLIGVLALQGDVREHIDAIRRAGGEAIPVKTREEIEKVDGLIIPGGESTTVGKLLDRFHLMDVVRHFPEEGKPIFGTCTGMILLAKDIEGSDQHRLGLMDVTVRRNAFGRQVDSFEEDVPVEGVAGGPVRAVFIRAPYITEVKPGVEVLAEHNGHPILVREGDLLAAAFHPELTDDTRIHQLFIAMVEAAKNRKK
ncbi:MAG TPA: pyridoxal 5'-phosphate synthase glutaminase subunit PdxT [Armatimonadota bacterium]|jgi:5'-phosphate synthase pdxT subunit|nr:pyridoxal 5'-phosphate synthase glutaminase subunit PdxT [Armatimonadota bacterium]